VRLINSVNDIKIDSTQNILLIAGRMLWAMINGCVGVAGRKGEKAGKRQRFVDCRSTVSGLAGSLV